MDTIFTPGVLIICAGGAFALGYLIINQMALRALMLIGSVFYVAYYATAAATPLWGAIYTTLAMMGTNLIGMGALAARRFTFSLPRAHVDIYDQFDVLTPGDFRLVMSRGERLVLDDAQQITTEGQPQHPSVLCHIRSDDGVQAGHPVSPARTPICGGSGVFAGHTRQRHNPSGRRCGTDPLGSGNPAHQGPSQPAVQTGD